MDTTWTIPLLEQRLRTQPLRLPAKWQLERDMYQSKHAGIRYRHVYQLFLTESGTHPLASKIFHDFADQINIQTKAALSILTYSTSWAYLLYSM